MQKKLIYTTLIFVISIFFFGCASSPPKEYKQKPPKKETKEVVPLQNSKTHLEVTLTVMTYNIRVGAGQCSFGTPPHKLQDCPRVLDFIARAIKSIDPDVVGLQEVEGEVQAKKLSKLLNMNYVYTQHGKHPMANWWGVAVLSKHDIINFKVHKVTGLGTKENFERALLETTIDANGKQITFFNTHFNHLANRKYQAKNAIKKISKCKNPVILMGDLNLQPTSPGLTLIKKTLKETCETIENEYSAYVKKCGTVPFPDDPDFIKMASRYFDIDEKKPVLRVDYIFYDPKSFSVVDVGLMDKKYWDASDHIAIMSRLKLL